LISILYIKLLVIKKKKETHCGDVTSILIVDMFITSNPSQFVTLTKDGNATA